MSAAVFWLDAKVLGLPGIDDEWVRDLDLALGRVRVLYPLSVVVVMAPLLSPTVRRRVALLMPDDIVGSSSASPVGISGAVVLDSHIRKVQGAQVGWLLAIEGHLDRLRSASLPVALLPIGVPRIDPPLIEDIESVLYAYERRTGASW